MNAAYFAGMPTAQRRRAARRYLAFATPPTRRLGRRGARRAAPVYPADGLRLRAGGAATWGNRLRPARAHAADHAPTAARTARPRIGHRIFRRAAALPAARLALRFLADEQTNRARRREYPHLAY